MKKILSVSALTAALLLSECTTAKQAVSAPVAAGMVATDTAATSTPGKFTFSGYMDTYYFGNFNQPADRLNTGVGGVPAPSISGLGSLVLAWCRAKLLTPQIESTQFLT